ncbi:hypothetical protein TanjilG_26592 [Lupinus angustifolius]|uniref:BHLH domain-containing protein n=1 Tax=Lupinus angustifolius TaxID=3871 RepID=A0A4P1QPY9_LUPAN|nr:hypothetical protein TanjilG_26592 [Lupinus angustifolius]
MVGIWMVLAIAVGVVVIVFKVMEVGMVTIVVREMLVLVVTTMVVVEEPFSLSDQLQEATNYIKTLEMKLEKMKDKKNRLLEIQRENMSMNKGGSKPPQIEIQQMGLALVIGLITGLDFQFMFKECIRFLLEEGAYIVSANYIVSGDSFFHTIHCQVEESSNGARISERLKMFVYDSCAFY